MAIEEFCGGVHDHVCAQRYGLLEIGRHEGIVDDQFGFLAVAYFGDGGEIAERHQRVGRRLDIDQACVFLNGALDVLYFGGVDVGELQAEIGEDLVEETWDASV